MFYLGPPGVRISIVRSVWYSGSGQKDKKHQSQLAGVSSSPAPFRWGAGTEPYASARSIGSRLAQSVASDAARGRFPVKVAKAFAKEISAKPNTCTSSCTIVNSTCISFFDGVNVSVNGCDNRYKLQEQINNNYIADDMQTQADVAPYYFVDLTKLDVYMVYTYSQYNTITHIEPGSPVKTNCSGGTTFTFNWFGVGLSSNEVTCAGTMSPWGLASYKGGGYWSGSLGNGEVTTEPVLMDHSTSHLSPESIMWISEASTATSVDASCPTPQRCG